MLQPPLLLVSPLDGVVDVAPALVDEAPAVVAGAPAVVAGAPAVVAGAPPPPELAPPLPAGAFVNEQYGALHTAPSPLHLQSASVWHQPSAPTASVPAGLQKKTLVPLGIGDCLVQLQTASPQAVPGQSAST